MTQHIAWGSYGGDARIELAIGLVAAAGAAVYAGTRLRHPVRAVRPGQGTAAVMFLAWAAEIVALLVPTGVMASPVLDTDVRKEAELTA